MSECVARNEALEEAIARAPDDIAGYAVYGDWLLEQSEPHGALIALHMRRHQGVATPTTDELVEEARLVREVFDDLKRLKLPVMSYTVKYGFLESLKIGGGGRRAGEVLRTTLTHRTAPFLRALEVAAAPSPGGRWWRPSKMDLDQKATINSVWQTIGELGLPATLRAATVPPPLGRDPRSDLTALAHVEELRWPLRALALVIEHISVQVLTPILMAKVSS